MELEPPQSRSLLGPLLTEKAVSDISLFGSYKPTLNTLVDKVMNSHFTAGDLDTDKAADENELPASFLNADSVAGKLTALRLASQDTPTNQEGNQGAKSQANPQLGGAPLSQLQRHEKLLSETLNLSRLPKRAQAVLDHIMLIRAREGYLFNYEKNQKIVADDSWLRDVWAWVAGGLATTRELKHLGI